MTAYFAPKDPAEVRIYAMDFSARLAVGETIQSCTWSIAIVGSSTNTGTALALSGVADIAAAPIVKQKVTGGIVGFRYRLKATVVTSLAQTIVGSAQLDVLDGGS